MLEIFQYEFMVRAFIVGIAIALVAPVIGMFLVVRRYALMTDTLAHVSLLGVAIALITGIHPLFGAIGISLVATIGMEKLKSSRYISGDSILALFLSGSLALAVMLITLNKGINANFTGLLFGSITTITSADMMVIVPLSLVVFIFLIILFRQFFLISLDEELAQAGGIKVGFLNKLLMFFAAITVSISIGIIGVLLMSALMVIPVMAAIQYRKSFKKTAIIATLISLVSMVSGLFISYYLSLPSGSTIVITALSIFLISLAINRR